MTAPLREPVDLDAATKPAGSDGSYEIELSDNWQLWGPSGGYLSAIALRAAGEIAQLPRPISFYCHFVRAPKFAQVEVRSEMVRHGARSESISVEIHQDGKLMLSAMVRTAAISGGFRHQRLEAPVAPRPEDVPEFRWTGPGADDYTYWNNFERRALTGAYDAAKRDPVQLEWMKSIPTPRFDDPFIDAARPLMALDTLGYIATNRAYFDERFIAPNLDTSAWFHDIGAQSDWLLIDHSSPVARDGVIAVEGKVWSEDGVLVASGAAQLLHIPG